MSDLPAGAATETTPQPLSEELKPLPGGSGQEKPKSELAQITDLLSGGAPEPSQVKDPPQEADPVTPDGGGASDPPPGEAPPGTLEALPGVGDEPHTTASLAKTLGVTKRELFDTMIPIGPDGESLPLSEVKELAVKYRSSEQEREDFNDNKTVTENRLLRQNNELQSYINELLPYIPPELGQRLQQRDKQHMKEQYNELFQVLPNLAKPEDMAAFQKGMLEHFEPYGIGAVMIANIKDASVLKYVNDMMAMEKKLTSLKAKKPVVAELPKGGRPPNRGKQINKAKVLSRGKGGSRHDKLVAISELLRG